MSCLRCVWPGVTEISPEAGGKKKIHYLLELALIILFSGSVSGPRLHSLWTADKEDFLWKNRLSKPMEVRALTSGGGGSRLARMVYADASNANNKPALYLAMLWLIV